MGKLLAWALYAVVGLVFGYSAVVKIADPEAFLSSILTFKLLPMGLATATALVVPWLELTLGLSLLSGVCRRGASWLSGGLLLLFIGLVVQARLRGLVIDCGCFGSNTISSDFEYAWKIGQNTLLLASLWAAAVAEGFLGGKEKLG